MVDKDMRYLITSKRWISEFRLDSDDLTGQSHYDVFPDLVKKWKDDHKRVFAGEIMKFGDEPFPRANGTLDWLRRELHPWYDADGEVGGLIMFNEVTTKRKLAEEALCKSEEQLRLITESVPAAISYVDSELRYHYSNATFEHYFGTTRESAKGRHMREIMGEEDYEKNRPYIEQAL